MAHRAGVRLTNSVKLSPTNQKHAIVGAPEIVLICLVIMPVLALFLHFIRRSPSLSACYLGGVLSWLLLVLASPQAASAEQPAGGTLPADTPTTGRWHELSFSGPDDGYQWHSLFYLAGIERPQLITRHKGFLIRCTAAPIRNNLRMTFAFGSVLRTNSRGEIKVDLSLDGKPRDKLELVTRNHANAEFIELGAKPLMAQLLAANTMQFSARLSPKGEARVALPLAPGRGELQALLERCGIDLAADVQAERSTFAARRRASRSPVQNAEQRTDLQRGVSAFLAANNELQLKQAIVALVNLDPGLDDLVEALGAEDALSAEARAGLPKAGEQGVSENQIGDLRIPFHVSVPERPHSANGMPMAIVLHGGVQRRAWRGRERWWQNYPFNSLLEDYLVVSPAAWRDAHWWGGAQKQNLQELIAKMQRHYPIDSTRIFVIGVSDGAAGALYQAMTNATPLAGVVSLIGHPGVLYDSSINQDVAPPLANLRAVPLFMVNGGVDQRMPIDDIKPWHSSIQALGVDLEAQIEPEMAHELDFARDTTRSLEHFLQNTARTQNDTELAWEAVPELLPSRHRWFVIEALQPGVQSGCVRARATKDGGFTLATNGVARLRVLQPHSGPQIKHLLINPKALNKSSRKPLALQSEPSVATLLDWYARDGDRSNFVGSEQVLEIATNTKGVCQSDRGHSLVAAATRRQARQRRQETLVDAGSTNAGQGPTRVGPQGDNVGELLGGEDQGNRGGSSRPAGDPTRIDDPRRARRGGIGPGNR